MTRRAEPASVTGLRLFLDTADRGAWARWLPTGLFHGVTTNPTLLQRAGLQCRMPVLTELVHDALRHDVAEIMVQTWGRETARLVENGRTLAALDARVVIKVPLTLDGLRACKRLSSEGTKVNVTLCFSANQALLAAKAGASFISPFIGRIDDAGSDGMELISEIRTIYDNYDFQTEILAASIRTVNHVKQAALIGADVATVPPATLKALVKRKAAGKTIAAPKPAERSENVGDLMDALRQSLKGKAGSSRRRSRGARGRGSARRAPKKSHRSAARSRKAG